MWDYGFKQIDAENWLQPDEATALFVDTQHPDEYAKAVLRATLSENVPQDVRALFEIARGALLYGYFFYPLYALAAGQLFRVAEAALIHKCTELGAPRVKKQKKNQKRMTFSDCIAWLVEKGFFTHPQADHWETVRSLRNSASHPLRQSIIVPWDALGLLHATADDINALFKITPKAQQTE